MDGPSLPQRLKVRLGIFNEHPRLSTPSAAPIPYSSHKCRGEQAGVSMV